MCPSQEERGGESREAWLTSRVAHLLTDFDVQSELVDEIMTAGGTPQTELKSALCLIVASEPGTPLYERARGSAAALLERQALKRAQTEWDRLMLSEERAAA